MIYANECSRLASSALNLKLQKADFLQGIRGKDSFQVAGKLVAEDERC